MENFYQKILSLFFPKRCINCQQYGSYLCPDCLSLIEVLIEQYCPFCSIAFDGTCPNCKKEHSLDGLFAATDYRNFVIRKAVQHFIHQPFIKELVDPLVDLLIRHISFSKKDLRELSIMPMPISKKEEKYIGFNPSEELAKRLSEKLGLPLGSSNNILLVDVVFNTNSKMDETAKELKQNSARQVFGAVIARK